MSKRVRISNDSLNSYGTRVLTSGMNVEQYCRNPVLLYQHERGQVIGYVKDLKVENDEVTGELMFDCASELSERCKKQYEFGSLRMVSVGIDILELSEDKQHLVQGQTCPTVIKSKLFEVSLVDIGANDDAIVLQKDGKRITLGKDGECPLPLLNNNNNQNQNQMDQKQIALQLGLPETADDAAITAAIDGLKAAKTQNDDLKKVTETLELERITGAVDAAIKEKRLSADKKNQFVELGKKVGFEELQNVLAVMTPQTKLSAIIGHQGGAPTGSPATYARLREVPADKILELREKDVSEYKRLFKAEYGFECEIED